MQLKRLTHWRTALAVILVPLCAGLAPAAVADAEADEIRRIASFLEVMNSFYELIDSVYEVSAEPERAAIMQLHKIQEAYEESGNKARAEPVLRKVLEDSDNPTIRAATYMMLGDLLKETGRTSQAIEVLEEGVAESLRNAQ